jgi:hypothetical protein
MIVKLKYTIAGDCDLLNAAPEVVAEIKLALGEA